MSITSGSKSQLTIVACVSGAGQTIPLLIIWKRKTMSPDMAVGELPGTQYGFSDSGSMKANTSICGFCIMLQPADPYSSYWTATHLIIAPTPLI